MPSHSPSLTPQSALTHPSVNPHFPSLNPHPPLNHPPLTPHSPLLPTHPITLHPSHPTHPIGSPGIESAYELVDHTAQLLRDTIKDEFPPEVGEVTYDVYNNFLTVSPKKAGKTKKKVLVVIFFFFFFFLKTTDSHCNHSARLVRVRWEW